MTTIKSCILITLILFLVPTDYRIYANNSLTQQPEPIAVYLTWQQSPHSSISVQWITETGMDAPAVYYRKTGSSEWLKVRGHSNRIPYLPEWVNIVEITELEPDQTYDFRVSDSDNRKFRTLPERLNRPVRFLAGGDIFHRVDWMENMNALAATKNPEFILIGGDLAYEDANPALAGRWLVMFQSMSRNFITTDGITIPILVSIGNHEVAGGYNAIPENAPGFYALFPFPGRPGYNVLDAGDYMSLYVLDTQHTNPIAGAQTKWLAQMLHERQQISHQFALYHIPAYPSFRPFDNPSSGLIRQHWVPLFDHYNLHFAFENHDHAFKRTYPICNNSIDESGVIYLGDGAWGVSTRKTPDDDPRWYIRKNSDERHFHLVTLTNDRREVRVYNENDVLIDQFSQRVSSGASLQLISEDFRIDGVNWKTGVSGMNALTLEMTNSAHPGLNDETLYHYTGTGDDSSPLSFTSSGGIQFSNSDSMEMHATGASIILDTRGVSGINAEWNITRAVTGTQAYGIRFQYRIGWSDTFTDMTVDGLPVEYSATSGRDTESFNVTLPVYLENQPHIELRWKYYFTETRQRTRSRNGDVIQLHDITLNPAQTLTAVSKRAEIPAEIRLQQNYPNPFNPVTVMRYSIPERTHVRLEVYSMSGIRIATLVNENRPAGIHSVSFDAAGLASGTYIYRLTAGDKTVNKRMTLIK